MKEDEILKLRAQKQQYFGRSFFFFLPNGRTARPRFSKILPEVINKPGTRIGKTFANVNTAEGVGKKITLP